MATVDVGGIGATGVYGVKGARGPDGYTGATGPTYLQVQTVHQRVARQAGCPGIQYNGQKLTSENFELTFA